MSVVPDKVTPELGWRTWRVEDKYGLELRSPNATASWLPGEVLRAQCSPTMSPHFFPAPHHPHWRWIVTERGDSSCVAFARPGEQVGTSGTTYCPPAAPRTVLPSGLVYGLTDESDHKRAKHGDAPEENCTCGIYALTSPRELVKQFGIGAGYAEEVIGRVALWGKVIPGNKGWRAQFAYPAEFFLLAPIWNVGGIRRRRIRKKTEDLAVMLQAWDVPVRVFENLDEFVRAAA